MVWVEFRLGTVNGPRARLEDRSDVLATLATMCNLRIVQTI